MEKLIENRYERNESTVKELCRYHYFNKPFYIAFDIILTVIFLIYLTLMVFGGNSYIACLILPPVLFGTQYLQYRLAAKSIIDRDKRMAGESGVEVVTTVDEDGFDCVVSTGSDKRVEFSGIKKAVNSREIIILITDAGFSYIFSKSGFTVGNAEMLAELLSKKGIKLKLQ